MTVKKGFSMRTMFLNALLVVALVGVSGAARADIQTGGTASEIFNSTAEPVITASPTVPTTTSSTTTNADGSVTVTITTTDADGTVHTQTKTTYPATTTTNSGSSGSSSSSGGSGNNLGQMLQGAAMQGLMGALGGNGGGMNGLPGLSGGMGNLGAALGGGTGGAGAGTGGGTQAPHVMTDAEKKAAEAKELEAKKKAAACRDANTIPVAKGSTEANAGKAKDDIVAGPDVGKDVAKPVQGPGMVASTCKPPKYDQAHPYGDGKIQSMADAEKYVGVCVQNSGQDAGNNASCQCVSLTKELGGITDSASSWRPGEKVQGNTDIPVGTPIATFNGPGKTFGSAAMPGGEPRFSHTGIYLGQNADGIQILHQYTKVGGGVITTIPWDSWSGGTNEAGNKYYVIANNSSSWLEMLWPYQTRLASALLNGHMVWYVIQG